MAGATSTLVVGEIDGETALLTTQAPNLVVCRLPLVLLPEGVAVGACLLHSTIFCMPCHHEPMLSTLRALRCRASDRAERNPE